MKKCNQLLATVGMLAIAGSAQATLINFQGLADSTIGESAWTSFSTAPYGQNINITADPSGAHVYFDARNAGLGVCSSGLNGTGTVDAADAFNRVNRCNDGADDNVDMSGEALIFNFNEQTDLNSIWLNNNHDTGNLTGKTVLFSVNGAAATSYTFLAADLVDPGYLGYRVDLGLATTGFSSFFSAGDTLLVAYGSVAGAKTAQQFYISAIDVPEPGPLALLGLGLVGLYAASKKKTA